HFFGSEFSQADFLSGLGDKDFIEDLIPRHAIYVPLLPQPVRAVIGRAHRDAEPARRVLEGEGFRFAGEVDIFDAGPLLGADVAWAAAGGGALVSVDPATGRTVWSGRGASAADVDRAVRAARAAVASWSQEPHAERERALRAFAGALEEDAGGLATAISLETG